MVPTNWTSAFATCKYVVIQIWELSWDWVVFLTSVENISFLHWLPESSWMVHILAWMVVIPKRDVLRRPELSLSSHCIPSFIYWEWKSLSQVCRSRRQLLSYFNLISRRFRCAWISSVQSLRRYRPWDHWTSEIPIQRRSQKGWPYWRWRSGCILYRGKTWLWVF